MTILPPLDRAAWTVDNLDDLPRGLRSELHDGVLAFKQPLTGLGHYPPERIRTVIEVVSPSSRKKDGDLGTTLAEIAACRCRADHTAYGILGG